MMKHIVGTVFPLPPDEGTGSYCGLDNNLLDILTDIRFVCVIITVEALITDCFNSRDSEKEATVNIPSELYHSSGTKAKMHLSGTNAEMHIYGCIIHPFGIRSRPMYYLYYFMNITRLKIQFHAAIWELNHSQ